MSEPRKDRRPPSRAEWIAIALAVIAVGVLVALWLRSRPEAPTTTAPAVAPAPTAQAEGTSGPTPFVPPEGMRALVGSFSADPLFRRWVGEGDLTRRWVVVTDNLAEGVSPRKQLAFLAPGRPFSVAQSGKATVIAPESYQRYDGFAGAVATIDAQAVAFAYRELHAVLEAGYRALGYPKATLDGVTTRALHRIARAPVRDGPVAVVAQDGMYAFADRDLEQLGSVEKHLLRLGPRNARLVQAKAREILGALKLPPADQGPGR